MFLWWYGPPIAYAALIFWLSHQPSLPSTPGGDLVAHFAAYSVLGGLLLRAFALGTRASERAIFAAAALLAALYGLSDEWHQSFVPGRHATFDDALADAAGGLAGAAFALLVYRKRRDR